MGLRIMRHKGRVGTRSILDIIFVIFGECFRGVKYNGKFHLEVGRESNLGLTRRNETPSNCTSATLFAKVQPIPLYTIGSNQCRQRFVRGSDLG